jgi:hypothetical protein
MTMPASSTRPTLLTAVWGERQWAVAPATRPIVMTVARGADHLGRSVRAIGGPRRSGHRFVPVRPACHGVELSPLPSTR